MDHEKYLESLSMELDSLKDRVRNFINNAHWLTDGEWKESVLRSVLRRNIPSAYSIGRGFIVTPHKTSSQIDILIYDNAKPVLFKEGDLVFVTPDAVMAAIEVKTQIAKSKVFSIIKKICVNASLTRNVSPSRKFFGLFSYNETDIDIEYLLNAIQQEVEGSDSRLINCIALGSSTFVRYWDLDPENSNQVLDYWYAYDLPKLAQGYFIHNVVESVCPESVSKFSELWYPPTGKEPYKIGEIALR